MLYRKELTFLAIILIGASLLLTLVYSLKADFRVSVGEFGDGPYIAGFNSDEAGAPRYRWTGRTRIENDQTSALINFPINPASGSNNRVRLELGSALAKDSGQKTPPIVIVLANGVEIGKAQTIEGVVKEFEFALPEAATKGDNFQLELRSPVFRAEGRTLGVKVQAIKLLTGPTLRIPPFEVWFWALVYAGAAGLLVGAWSPRPVQTGVRSAIGGLVLLLPILAIPYLAPASINLWYGPSNNDPYLMQVAAWVMAAVAAVAWVGKIGDWLWEFPARLEQENLARNLLMIVSLIYFVYAFAVIAQMDFIGHADYADNGVVARNLIRGNGLSVDYAAQFYTRYDKLPHPADTWPLLQPLLIAPFFAVLGPTAFAAKLPNLIIMLALAWAIFRWGSHYFNRTTGLGAAILALGAPALFETVAYPINDLAFTFFTFLLLMNVYRASQYRPIAGAADTETEIKEIIDPDKPKITQLKRLKSLIQVHRLWLWSGLWGGLLLWSKPSGGIVLVATGLWLLWQKFWNKQVKIEWYSLLLWGGLVLLVISPYIGRSFILGNTPIYSTERYDVWTLEYAPWERIYNPYYVTGQPLPAPNQLLGYGFDTIVKVKYNQFRDAAQDFMSGKYAAPLLWLFGIVGLVGLSRRRYGLLGLVAFSFLTYFLFITLYWHYEIRYFMVWLPWLFLLGVYGLSWLYQKLRQNENEPRAGKLGVWLMAGVFAVLLLPNLPTILDPGYTGKTGIVTTSEWIKANTPANAVIMTRVPWQLSFHADRKSVMIPNNITKVEQLRPILNDYKVKYIQFSYINQENGQPDDAIWRERTGLWDLIVRKPVSGFKLVYDKDGFLVYEITG